MLREDGESDGGGDHPEDDDDDHDLDEGDAAGAGAEDHARTDCDARASARCRDLRGFSDGGTYSRLPACHRKPTRVTIRRRGSCLRAGDSRAPRPGKVTYAASMSLPLFERPLVVRPLLVLALLVMPMRALVTPIGDPDSWWIATAGRDIVRTGGSRT